MYLPCLGVGFSRGSLLESCAHCHTHAQSKLPDQGQPELAVVCSNTIPTIARPSSGPAPVRLTRARNPRFPSPPPRSSPTPEVPPIGQNRGPGCRANTRQYPKGAWSWPPTMACPKILCTLGTASHLSARQCPMSPVTTAATRPGPPPGHLQAPEEAGSGCQSRCRGTGPL